MKPSEIPDDAAGMSSRKPQLSICGTLAILHLSTFLGLVMYEQSLVGPGKAIWDGTVTRPRIEFVDRAYAVLVFPIGYLVPQVFDGRRFVTYDGIVVGILLMAANAVLVGSAVEWLYRRGKRRLQRRPRLPEPEPQKFLVHPGTWWIAFAVAWGTWNGQTDCYPLNEFHARPSSFAYGWPICFATSSRGRFNFIDFDPGALLVDLTLSAAMIGCTVFAAEYLGRRIPRLSIADMLAMTAGVTAVLVCWSDGLVPLWQSTLGAVLPDPEVAARAGDVQPASRLSPYITFPVSLGVASIGFTMVALPLLWANRRSGTDRPKNMRTSRHSGVSTPMDQ